MTTLDRRVRGTRDPAGQEVILTPNRGLQTERQALADPELLVLSSGSQAPPLQLGRSFARKTPVWGNCCMACRDESLTSVTVEKPGTSQECSDTKGAPKPKPGSDPKSPLSCEIQGFCL